MNLWKAFLYGPLYATIISVAISTPGAISAGFSTFDVSLFSLLVAFFTFTICAFLTFVVGLPLLALFEALGMRTHYAYVGFGFLWTLLLSWLIFLLETRSRVDVDSASDAPMILFLAGYAIGLPICYGVLWRYTIRPQLENDQPSNPRPIDRSPPDDVAIQGQGDVNLWPYQQAVSGLSESETASQ